MKPKKRLVSQFYCPACGMVQNCTTNTGAPLHPESAFERMARKHRRTECEGKVFRLRTGVPYRRAG